MMISKVLALCGVLHTATAVPTDPKAAAAAMIARMTLEEKVTMLHGGRAPGQAGYVGNTPPIKRLGIPALNLNDGPQGFRSGKTTCWPSGLTVATTWDMAAMRAWGAAMGGEFFGKGANVQLGPGVCVARVPNCGRNFEYLSGEDPYLGFELVQPVIRGIQSRGVIANAKHWVNNNQETDRSGGNEVVDERTRWEIYYPPFLGAIKAEVGSIMCSYNRINGNYSCGNNETLNTDYKMYKFGLFDHISQWNGTAHQNDVTSLHNSWLARNISAASTVLLKNNGILPLKPGKKIVLIGADALSPFVHGGGSGSVQPTYTISPFSAIQQRNAGKRPASGPGGGAPLPPVKCTVMDNHTDYYIGGSARQPMKDASVAGCCNACGDSPTGFSYFTFTGKDCWCHKKIGQKRNHAGYVSGACRAVPPPGPPPSANDVTTATGTGAAAAAAAADVAVVFIHTTSSEGSDRKSLSFADADNAMVEAVAKAQKNTVVVMVNPGAVLTPWTGSVAAALTMFMPGLEMGNAISDVLYGDVNPSGRLPLTFPNKENEVGFTTEQWPGVRVKTGLQSTYTEKLEVGYRWYDTHAVKPKYPFGHGLSYTKFSYSNLKVDGKTIAVTVKNTGGLAGAEIAQMYLGFPTAAGEPPKQLKGFHKVQLAAGASSTVSFNVMPGDLAVWDATKHAWTGVSGSFKVFVGASSRDIRATGTLTNTATPGEALQYGQ